MTVFSPSSELQVFILHFCILYLKKQCLYFAIQNCSLNSEYTSRFMPQNRTTVIVTFSHNLKFFYFCLNLAIILFLIDLFVSTEIVQFVSVYLFHAKAGNCNFLRHNLDNIFLAIVKCKKKSQLQFSCNLVSQFWHWLLEFWIYITQFHKKGN